MLLISTFLVFLLTLIPSNMYVCDNEEYSIVMRNNINGDFALVNDLGDLKSGAFIVIESTKKSLMLPLIAKKDEISFSDRKWLWSFKDLANGILLRNPRFAEVKPNGDIFEYLCLSKE